jgi:hypothetical protein
VVAEARGAISLAYDSKLNYDLSPLEITRKHRELLDKGARKGISGTAASDDSGDTGSGEGKGAFVES